MGKRKKLKKFWSEKVIPNKRKIAYRVFKTGVVYTLTGPTFALASNGTAIDEIAKELLEGYAGITQSCLGGKKLIGFIPMPKSYLEGSLCAALLLTCGAAAAQGFGNGLTDAACVAILRNLAEQNMK
jgi:hypothetical protein